ncbi:MAG: cyclic nucleotide-binding domain-containing protein [Chloroflexi bacterium]|nr:cyclic nucleotide-binding domain-containing protein [Chloroflexota bacterium]
MVNALAQPSAIKRKRDCLRSVGIFERLPEQALDHLALLCEHHTCSDGEIVFRQGDRGDRMYLVESGRVLLFYSDAAGNVRQLATVEPGGYFGELALLSNNPRAASAECEGETELLSLSGHDLKRLLAESAPAMRGLIGATRAYEPPQRCPRFWERFWPGRARGRGQPNRKRDAA